MMKLPRFPDLIAELTAEHDAECQCIICHDPPEKKHRPRRRKKTTKRMTKETREMRPEKEIRAMIEMLTRLHNVIPRRSRPGIDYRKKIDLQIQVLTTCLLSKDKLEIGRLKTVEERAFNWALGRLSYDLTDEEDVENWERSDMRE